MSLDSSYYPIDEFYKWMEEPMANFITLEYFEKYNYLGSADKFILL
jgi:hypothetical protein